MIFDARRLGRAWQVVALASSNDKNDAILYRTVLVEVHAKGVQLVACDRFMFMRAWVPEAPGDDMAEPPGLDEVPVSVALARDVDNRARALAAYMLALTDGGDAEPLDARLHIDTMPAGAQSSFDGMDTGSLVMEVPGVERVVLPVIDAAFPAWRSLVAGHVARKTDALALNPDIVGRLAKAKRWGYGQITWVFGGENKAARLVLEHPDDPVEGLIMPIRLDEVPA